MIFMLGKLMNDKKINMKSGFTLIEVLVALAVFGVLSVSLFTSFRTYTGIIDEERRMAMESVRIQKTFREVEEYIRSSTQDIKISRECLAANGQMQLTDENKERKGNPLPPNSAAGYVQDQPRHDITFFLNNRELSYIKNPTLDGAGNRTVGIKKVLSPDVTSFCISEQVTAAAHGKGIDNQKIVVTVKSGVDGLREVTKFIPFRGQFRDR